MFAKLRLLILLASVIPLRMVVADDRLVRESEPLSPAAQQAVLRVPEGFRIECFASEPMINKPINLGFDRRGRLWVSSTVEYPFAADKARWADAEGSRVRDSRDAIKILEDTDGDGKADRVIDFADGLNIPTGVLPWHRPEHADGCIAWSIPNIWYFADTDGDGKCDLREVLFGPLGYEKDTHGMCSSFRLGPDGWIYATHGFNNSSQIRARDGSALDLHSGNVFRFRPDASRVEIWSWGQVNPFGLCFDRRGNLYSADCHSAPVYQLLPGAHYPSFGKPHDGLGFAPAMIEHSHGSTGIAGLVYVDGGVWGSDWDDRVLLGNPVASRVNLDRIEYAGSTPRAVEQPDFVVSGDPWFRPVDLALGPDGALYIADFYNRIIGHYEVPLQHPGRDRERGRIWRVVKDAGVHVPPTPQREVVADPVAALTDASPFRRRAAAAVLQETPRTEALPALRQALGETPAVDTHLRHALRLSLRETLKQPGAFGSISGKPDPELASIALAVPSAEAAAYLLDSAGHWSALAREIIQAQRVHIARHGTPETVERLIALTTSGGSPANLDAALEEVMGLEGIVAGLEERGSPLVQPALLGRAQALARELLAARDRLGPAIWTAAAHPEDPKSADPWTLQVRACADGSEATVISSLKKGERQAEQRTGTLRSRPFPAPEVLSFWLCGHRGFPQSAAHERNFVRLMEAEGGAELARVYPPRNDVCQPVRWELGAQAGKAVQLEIVDGDMGNAYAWLGLGRIEGAEGVTAESFRRDDQTGQALGQLAEWLKVSAPADLRDRLRPYLPPAPEPPPREISPEERERLEQLIASRVAAFGTGIPNQENGAALFRTHCAVCHRIGGEGGLIGPQLDGIGSRGVARLAEDILDPNRNIDAHFRVTTWKLKDGTVAGGFVLAERGEVLQVVDAAGQTRRLAKGDIASQETLGVSLMPGIFGNVLSETDFRDLVGWLLRQQGAGASQP